MIRSLFFLKDLKHRHVLLDEAGILATELSDHKESLAPVSQKLNYVKHQHSVSTDHKRQSLHSWIFLHRLWSL